MPSEINVDALPLPAPIVQAQEQVKQATTRQQKAAALYHVLDMRELHKTMVEGIKSIAIDELYEMAKE
jgi:hypothetical protein